MKISFFGAAEEVGRSCILISTEHTKIILDAGIKLGEKIEYPELPLEIIKDIDAIFISHAHLDHCGYLPHIYSHGYKGNTYATKPTIELTNVLISDYMRISNPQDVTKEGMQQMNKGYKIVEYGKEIKIKDLTIKLIPAGHILGSALTVVSDGKHRIIYTGDINLTSTRLLPAADTKNLQADTLITESTYGSKKDIFPSEKTTMTSMLKSMNETIAIGGKIIIPSFAVGRGQEVLFILDDYMNSGAIPKTPIYVDGMINKAMRIYRHNVIYCRKEIQYRILMSDNDPFKSDNFVVVTKPSRNKIIFGNEASIIVTTSGMLTGGPVLTYVEKLAKNESNKLILVGYQAEGTLGRALKDGEKNIQIDGKNVKVAMHVHNYHLSAHADRKQLELLMSRVKGLKNVFIVHGEKSKAEELRADIAHKYNAIVPKIGSEHNI